MAKFVYPGEFVAEVKATFPDWSRMHEALDCGHEVVGRYLDDSSTTAMEAKHVLQMLETGKEVELKAEAARRLKIAELYKNWQGTHLARYPELYRG